MRPTAEKRHNDYKKAIRKACKTNNRKCKCFGPRHNWSIQDKRNLDELNYQEEEDE